MYAVRDGGARVEAGKTIIGHSNGTGGREVKPDDVGNPEVSFRRCDRFEEPVTAADVQAKLWLGRVSHLHISYSLPGQSDRDDDPWENQLRFGTTRSGVPVNFENICWADSASVNAARANLIRRCP